MSRDNKELPVELECGTSLAEGEHYQLADYCEREEASPIGETEETIESLQEMLGSDVLTDDIGQPYTMFASPFQVPRATLSATQQADGDSKFYRVPLVYCDHTASNRPSRSIERYIERVCLPLYGNTHTSTSITGTQRYAFFVANNSLRMV